MQEQDQEIPNDIIGKAVWARIGGHPYWPGKVKLDLRLTKC